MRLCQHCGVQKATLKRGAEVVCTECFNEPTPPKPGEWDRVINPVYILALEKRIKVLEEDAKEYVKALYGLGDILRDMNKVDVLTDERFSALEKRIAELERITRERTADS